MLDLSPRRKVDLCEDSESLISEPCAIILEEIFFLD
tara:strand:- start:2 stop:109 length:108 start_codon:yes stop_codon:yes gene_type:complete